MVKMTINGKPVKLDADPAMPLLWALRDQLGLTGTKYGCGKGLCGACTVHLDGQAARACSTPLSAAAGRSVTTIEGLLEEDSHDRELGLLISTAWQAENVPQCGYCQPGQIMSACAFLKQNPRPDKAQIRSAMAGNLCRCGTYPRIQQAIVRAAQELNNAP